MRAMVIEEFGGVGKIKLKEMPKPEVGEGDVLIRVAYAGVNPIDQKITEGYLKDRMPYEFPIILGWDAAGHVEQVGRGVKNFKVGDEVYAYLKKDKVQWGGYAEFVTCAAKNTAMKPKSVSFAQAAALPTVSLTAWQSLFDAARLKEGETVFITGASGGVGSMGVQFAKWAGAKVIGTASPQKHDYVKKLGADQTLDYHINFADEIKVPVDVVFDCVGGDMNKRALACLKKGGRIVSLLEREQKEAEKLGMQAYYVFVAPNGEQLKKIAELIDEKKVALPHIEEMPLEKALEANEKLKNGEVLGKLVLKVEK